LDDELLSGFQRRLQGGPDAAFLDELEQTVIARRDVRAGHTAWGLLCEDAGLLPLAFREFQLALRDDPHDATAAFRLAQHYRERGDTGRAADLLERLLQGEPTRPDWLTLYAEILHDDNALPRLLATLRAAVQAGFPAERARDLERGPAQEEAEEPSEDTELVAANADCIRFQGLFAGREDVHARQWAGPGGEGGYSPVEEPLTPAVVRNHLLGTYTVGVYPIRLDGTCTFFAIDLDIDKAALEKAQTQPALARSLRDAVRAEALRLRAVLRDFGFVPVLEDSGYKGRHLWVFLEQPEPADVLHLLGRLLLAAEQPHVPPGLHLEFFPKQAGRKGKGLGNLIKLPLGIHRRTGRRALLLDGTGQPLPQPLAALRKVVRASRGTLHAALERLKLSAAPVALGPLPGAETEPPRPATGPPPPPTGPGWTEADPRVRHLLGHCPVLAALKRQVDENRSLSHEEQLVLIHTLGHLEGGPLAVNYLLGKCVDVGPEKFLKDRLKGNPVSCPSIRKKIGHVTRKVPCNCPFDFAPDRYPTPVLHLLTLPPEQALPTPAAPAQDVVTLARRYGVLAARREEIQREYDELRRALVVALRETPDRTIVCPGGRYRLTEAQGVEELCWEGDSPQEGTKSAKEESVG
jgi:hypothetical protein